ncbi:MAG: hypothetical protein GEV12_16170, partial [Micromonosporaceae bacterium]|nr:hypothetical protein [Micromonosporaceae bacterium]
ETAAAGNQRLYGVNTPAEVIDKYQPGGIIYFTAARGPDNVRNPRQIAGLSNGLQAAATGLRQPIPLLISTDQEGGALVFRLGAPATAMPGKMALGAGRSAADAHRSAEVIGTELAAVGINQNYAPVADVNVNPAGRPSRSWRRVRHPARPGSMRWSRRPRTATSWWCRR